MLDSSLNFARPACESLPRYKCDSVTGAFGFESHDELKGMAQDNPVKMRLGTFSSSGDAPEAMGGGNQYPCRLNSERRNPVAGCVAECPAEDPGQAHHEAGAIR